MSSQGDGGSDGEEVAGEDGQHGDTLQGIELHMAHMETRLRSAITDLLQPTVQRMTVLTSEVDTIKLLVSQHAKGLNEVQLGQLRAQEQVSTVTAFKEEMGRWDTQRRTAEAATDEKVEAAVQKIEAFRFSLEQKESALHHLNRSLDRVAGEVNRLLEDQDNNRDVSELRIDEQSRKLSLLRADIDVRFAGLEQKHNALSDELWGDELGLAKMAGELKKTNATFGKLEDAVAHLQASKAESVQLDKLRSEVAMMVHEANSSTTAMRHTVGEVVNDVREHFRTASQTIASHNANFVREIRGQYQEELANSAQLRDEVEKFMGSTSERVDMLEQRGNEVKSKASSLAAEAREELEELNRRRKRDKTSADNELKALKKRLGGVFDNSDAVLRGLEHIYSVLQPVLESELMGCALERQDAIDREKISLMGVKDDGNVLARTTQSEPQHPRPECRVKSAPQAAQRGAHGGVKGGPGSLSARGAGSGPVVRVDNRCVSCSGQAPLVLAAFKMACLHYAPSPVDHGGTINDRWELLQRRQQLLHLAHAALLEGPGGLGGLSPGGQGGGAPDSSGGEDKDGRPFAEYAAIEAKFQTSGNNRTQKQSPRMTGSSNMGSSLRLPDVSNAASTPRMVTVR
eukprot:CAMPEP_0115060022 /NCGR_PEP_ID=MMETSP0227-20121206/7236_1 /TAXON_ID=89957 /ORGANISM="Polarella glacialis, Strain CCMP 1383" /LENGTH=628 /DNA_ID=CAMNT_0002445197 /DNA_START=74 /DNA_END=1959 /DNA_ORIENTATION=-